MVCFLNSQKQIVKTCVRLDACLIELSFGKIIGLMHALEKRYYQNKTQLRYNLGSVYNSYKVVRKHFVVVKKR